MRVAFKGGEEDGEASDLFPGIVGIFGKRNSGGRGV